MWIAKIVTLACLIAVAQSTPMPERSAALEWALTWRTARPKLDSQLFVLGARPSVPIEIAAVNRGKAALQVERPDKALVVEMETDEKAVSGRLTCDDDLTVVRRSEGSMRAVEHVDSEVITLLPEDSMRAACELTHAGGGLFTPGYYRVTITSSGWQGASLSKKSWNIEIRESTTTEDRRLFHLTEGDELFRRTAYAAAAKHFELARSLDPASLTATLSLVGAYERLDRYRDAVKLLEIALPLARELFRQYRLEERTVQAVTRRLAMAYVIVGKEQSATALLKRSGFSSEQTQQLIVIARSRRR
jgi:hypothetical protein